jgi:hypothetical protein
MDSCLAKPKAIPCQFAGFRTQDPFPPFDVNRLHEVELRKEGFNNTVQKPVNTSIIRPIPIKPVRYVSPEITLDEEINFRDACDELYEIVHSNKPAVYF